MKELKEDAYDLGWLKRPPELKVKWKLKEKKKLKEKVKLKYHDKTEI